MAWYHWIATYTIILSSAAIFTIPKPMWATLFFVFLIALGVIAIMILPEKDDAFDQMKQREAEELKQKGL